MAVYDGFFDFDAQVLEATGKYDREYSSKDFTGYYGAFIGSDTMMVAPVSIGERAVVAAGSCITRDVSPDALGVARSRQTEVEGWAAKHQAASKG